MEGSDNYFMHECPSQDLARNLKYSGISLISNFFPNIRYSLKFIDENEVVVSMNEIGKERSDKNTT